MKCCDEAVPSGGAHECAVHLTVAYLTLRLRWASGVFAVDG